MSEITLPQITSPDITQLGLVRNRLEPEYHMVTKGDFRFRFTDKNVAAAVGKWVGATFVADEDYTATIADLGDTYNVEDLQKALCPKVSMAIDEFVDSAEYKELLEVVERKAEIANEALKHAFVTLEPTHADRKRALAATGLDDVTDAFESLPADFLLRANFAEANTIVSTGTAKSVLDKDTIEAVLFRAYIAKYGFDKTAVGIEPAKSLWTRKQAAAHARAVQLPSEIEEILDSSRLNCAIRDEEDEVARGKKAAMFVHYMVNYSQGVAVRVGDPGLFAEIRTDIVRNNLLGMSDEVCSAEEVFDDAVTIDRQALESFVLYLRNAYRARVINIVTAICFLRCGHHTADVGFFRMYQRISEALQRPDATVNVQQRLSDTVHQAVHPADMRLRVSWIKRLAANPNTSEAISARTSPAPPTFAAYRNLGFFVKSLRDVGFFRYFGKDDRAGAALAAIDTLLEQAPFAAPYADYLYGTAKAVNPGLKDIVNEFASYAHSIAQILPNSSLADSPALRRLAAQAANNAISADIQVNAFVDAYKTFYARSIRQQLAGKAEAGFIER